MTVEVVETTAVLRLNRPEALNAINEDLHARLATVWSEVAEVDGLRAAVLTGAGDAFSAGGDLNMLERMADENRLRDHIMAEAMEIAREVVRFPLPLVAAVNGPAVGLGCSLASFADLVVMEENAYLADPHVALGLVAGDGSVLTWPYNIGVQRAKEWILFGGRIDAAEALRIGLANRVVPVGEGLAQALHLAKKAARLPSQAVRETLLALNGPLLRRIDTELPGVVDAESASFDEAEFRTNLDAMLARSRE